MSPGDGHKSDSAATVRVVVVNFNAGRELLACAKSVLEQRQGVTLTVIDNASTDDSMQILEAELADNPRVQLIRNEHNRGFSSAVNQAARMSGTLLGEAEDAACGELLILNPDCVLHDGCLSELQGALASHPQAALAAPQVLNANGSIARGTYRRFPNPWNSLVTLFGLSKKTETFQGVELSQSAPDKTVVAEAVSGACMLVNARRFEELGGLDEDYRLHCEDLDLMFRFKQAGDQVLYVPSAIVTHLQGVSSKSRPFWVHHQKHAGMARFYRKFQAPANNVLFRALVISGIWVHYLLTLPLVAWKR